MAKIILSKLSKALKSNKLENLERDLKQLSTQKITSLNPRSRKILGLTINNKDVKLANDIRNARVARSTASAAALKFMQENPQLGKLLKSGSREFSSAEAKAGINAARLKAYQDLGYGVNPIASNLKKLGQAVKRNLGKIGTLGTLGLMAYNYEPTAFYARDLKKGILNSLGFDTPSTERTEEDMSDDFNNQAQELAALAIAMGQKGLTPEVYRAYNQSHGREAKYADFKHPLKFFNPGQRVEYSDGGMSMSKSKNDTGYDVVLTDAAAWDPDPGKSYLKLSPRGIPVALGVTRKNMGDKIDTMRYTYNIPQEKVDSMRNVYNQLFQ